MYAIFRRKYKKPIALLKANGSMWVCAIRYLRYFYSLGFGGHKLAQRFIHRVGVSAFANQLVSESVKAM
jgi:hypothetical protein